MKQMVNITIYKHLNILSSSMKNMENRNNVNVKDITLMNLCKNLNNRMNKIVNHNNSIIYLRIK